MSPGLDTLPRVGQGRQAEIFAWGEGKVLRLMRSPESHELARREAAALAAARAGGAPVPALYGLEEVRGRPGLLMERVDGPDLLTLIGRRPWSVFSGARKLGELHARLHQPAAPDALPPLRPYLRERIGSSELVPPEIARAAGGILDGLPDGDSLCHGDFHPANVLLSAAGPMVIDWTNATRGDPVADVARSRLLIETSPLPPGAAPLLRVVTRFGRRLLLHFYVRSYRRHRWLDSDRLARWELVSIADRLTADVEGERAVLLRLFERRSS